MLLLKKKTFKHTNTHWFSSWELGNADPKEKCYESQCLGLGNPIPIWKKKVIFQSNNWRKTKPQRNQQNNVNKVSPIYIRRILNKNRFIELMYMWWRERNGRSKRDAATVSGSPPSFTDGRKEARDREWCNRMRNCRVEVFDVCQGLSSISNIHKHQ